MLENSENYTQVINIGLNHQFEKITSKRKCMQTILYIDFFYYKYAS